MITKRNETTKNSSDAKLSNITVFSRATDRQGGGVSLRGLAGRYSNNDDHILAYELHIRIIILICRITEMKRHVHCQLPKDKPDIYALPFLWTFDSIRDYLFLTPKPFKRI
jgi:hypothetical protein